MSPIVASCLKKKAYSALEAAAVVEASTEPGLQVYPCPVGGHFHIGHKRTRRRKRK
jgi:hypothetical protein